MFGIENSANNFGRSAGILANTLANRPIRAALGTLFIATDTLEIYRWTGSLWLLLGGGGTVFGGATNGCTLFSTAVGLGGTLQQSTNIYTQDLYEFTISGGLGDVFHIDTLNDIYVFGKGQDLDTGLQLNLSASSVFFSYLTYQTGLNLDFANRLYQLGDYNNNYFNGTKLIVDVFNSNIRTQYFASDLGLNLDFANNIYYLGDFGVVQNETYIKVDDGAIKITFRTNSGYYNFQNIQAFPNNAAALAGGLLIGDIYRHSGGTGEQLHIVY